MVQTHSRPQEKKKDSVEAGPKTTSKPGFLETIRRLGEAKRVYKLVYAASMSTNGTSAEKLGRAVEIFSRIGPEKQTKQLRKIHTTLLSGACSHTFEADVKARRVLAIAQFMSMISDHFPKDEYGDPILPKITAKVRNEKEGPGEPRYVEATVYDAQEIIRNLAYVVEEYDPDARHKEYPHVRLACAEALWKLAYPDYKFWEQQARDPDNQEFVIKQLLEMPQLDDFEAHGWSLLRGNIDRLGISIALNPSPKNVDFFERMMRDDDPHIVKVAFAASSSLDEIPGILTQRATEIIQENSKYTSIAPTASTFIQGIDRIWDEVVGDEEPDEVPAEPKDSSNGHLGTIAIFERYIKGLSSLIDVHDDTQAVMDPDTSKNDVIDAPTKEPQQDKGEIGIDPEIIAKMWDMLNSEDPKVLKKLFNIYLTSKKFPDDLDLANAVTEKAREVVQKNELCFAAFDFLQVVQFKKDLEKDGETQERALEELCNQYLSGKTYLMPLIGKHYTKMAKLVFEGDKKQKQQARKAVRKLAEKNLIKTRFYVTVQKEGNKTVKSRKVAVMQTVVDALFEAGETEILRKYLEKSYLAIAHSKYEEKASFLRTIIAAENPEELPYAFESALHMSDLLSSATILDSFTILALSVADFSKDETVSSSARDFLEKLNEMIHLKEMLETADERQFSAAKELVELYSSGKLYLRPLLVEASKEMADIIQEPAGETDEEKETQRKEALAAIVQLATAGVTAPGVNVNFKIVKNASGEEIVSESSDPDSA